ncbi:MAG: glutathione S-transferase domain-containing protein [Verrucomicrobia bacterium]|nr:glutathione S-transferase domain-containing protein [Verrucomicrobiota bacterium]
MRRAERTPSPFTSDALGFVRHKDRKFGRGCLDRWRGERKQLLAAFEAALAPYEAMLATRPFLLDDRPRFVDFDLYGMIFNFLWTGHYRLPAGRPRLRAWHDRICKVRLELHNHRGLLEVRDGYVEELPAPQRDRKQRLVAHPFPKTEAAL